MNRRRRQHHRALPRPHHPALLRRPRREHRPPLRRGRLPPLPLELPRLRRRPVRRRRRTQPPATTPTTKPSATPTQAAPLPSPTPTHSSDPPPRSDRIENQSAKLPPCVTTSTPSAGGTIANSSPGGINSARGTTSPGNTNSPGAPGGDQTRTALSNGHADYAVRLEGGELAAPGEGRHETRYAGVA